LRFEVGEGAVEGDILLMAAAVVSSVDYGIDAPLIARGWFGRAGWSLGIGLLFWLMNQQDYPGPAARVLGALALVAVVCAAIGWYKIRSSRESKLALREQLLDQLELKGDEKVLDVGCGRGLLAIGAAKRLKTGKVTGIDVWNPQDLSGNSPEAAKENAKAEGVSDRVRFDTGDARKLVYPDNFFDAVMSSNALHTLDDDRERKQALKEMLRVLKPGGRLVIFDTAETGYYAEVLRDCGAQDMTLSSWTWLWCRPSRSLAAHK
jgi:ubiquinone/menaquinone biosynthesis C-methylase UbiE